MTLEKAIKHAEEVAEENEKEFRLCPYPTQDCNGNQDCRCLENGSGKGCLRYAAEHRQLAEWLRELKERRRKNACYERLVEAVDTAISALHAQEVKHSNESSVLDTISRQAAIDAVQKYKCEHGYDYADCACDIEKDLKALPSAQQEIIHCRDCKHYYYADNRIPQEQRFVCELEGERWKPDDYCSYAERREDGQTT